MIRYQPTRVDGAPLRARLRESAVERRRFGYRRLGYLLACEDMTTDRKKLLRIVREVNLRVRRRGGRERALGNQVANGAAGWTNQRWSLDIVSDTLTRSRCFRILCMVDDHTRECLHEKLFTSLAHARFVLDAWRHDYNKVTPHLKLGGTTPAEIAGQRIWEHPQVMLPSHQTAIIKEPDSTFECNNQGIRQSANMTSTVTIR